MSEKQEVVREKLTQGDVDVVIANHHRFENGEVGGVKADFFEKDCKGLDFTKAGSMVGLMEVSFYGADLRGANFSETCVGDSNFKGALLQDAKLEGADFGLCQLQGANVSGAKIDGFTSFEGADVEGAKFKGVNVDYLMDSFGAKDVSEHISAKEMFEVISGSEQHYSSKENAAKIMITHGYPCEDVASVMMVSGVGVNGDFYVKDAVRTALVELSKDTSDQVARKMSEKELAFIESVPPNAYLSKAEMDGVTCDKDIVKVMVGKGESGSEIVKVVYLISKNGPNESHVSARETKKIIGEVKKEMGIDDQIGKSQDKGKGR